MLGSGGWEMLVGKDGWRQGLYGPFGVCGPFGGRSPLPFFENQNKCSDFAKKYPDCVHPYVKVAIQNVVLRVSKRKNSKIFPAGPYFLTF